MPRRSETQDNGTLRARCSRFCLRFRVKTNVLSNLFTKTCWSVVDNPAKMDENKLAESKLPKLWDKSAVIDSMEKRVVVYGKGLNVKPAANNYGFVYEKTSPHAFALQITTFMDPEVSVDFANKDDADKFYAEIVDFGMVEDENSTAVS